MLIDALSKQHFNQKVSFDCPRPFSLGGVEIDDRLAALLTGALDGSAIDLALSYPDDDETAPALGATLTVRHEYFARPAQYEITQTDTGYACLATHYVVLRQEHTNQGLGIRMFVQQVFTADLLGISQIWLHAVGDGPEALYNGSYTWPRYGFEPHFDNAQRTKFSERFPEVQDLAELMATPGGRARWRADSFSSTMCFDLSEDRCWGRLEQYMREKGVLLDDDA